MLLRHSTSSIAAALLGFLIADVSLVVFLAPELASPENWPGLLSLILTAAIMYAGVGLYMAIFTLIIILINKLLRLRFEPRTIALISVIASVLFLIYHEKIHTAMLAKSVSPNELVFYLPTAITLAIIAAVMVLTRFLFFRSNKRKSVSIPRPLKWPGLSITAALAFFLYASTFKMLNVLAVYPEEEQRDLLRESVPFEARTADEDAPNFMIFMIEAYRWDEFNQENSPFLFQLAKENIYLDNYFVTASATRPSTTSLFTSLYPAQHGAYNLAFDQEHTGQQPITTTKVSDAIKSFPKQLQENGYNTLMVSSNKLAADRVFGFEQIFNQFSSANPYQFQIPDPEPFLGFFILQNSLKHWKIFKALLFTPDHSRTYFDSSRLNPVAENLLASRDDRPYFLYVHYIEPHTPYYADPYRAVQLTAISKNGMLDYYRQELSRIDRSIEEIYSSLQQRGDLENTWIMITADHGEEFYDHGNWGHGKSLYPEVIKVPAIIVPPENHANLDLPIILNEIIENVDIAPTIAEIAGLETPQYWEGKSLIPLLDGRNEPSFNTALGQFNDGRYLWSSGIRDNWQIIYREPANAVELSAEERLGQRTTYLFNIENDPLAQNNLFSADPDAAAAMTDFMNNEIYRLETSAVLFQGEKEEVTEEQLEQLRALGYID